MKVRVTYLKTFDGDLINVDNANKTLRFELPNKDILTIPFDKVKHFHSITQSAFAVNRSILPSSILTLNKRGISK